jgi:secreted PhoX family phosphatase
MSSEVQAQAKAAYDDPNTDFAINPAPRTNAHCVSAINNQKKTTARLEIADSGFNRRITGAWPIALSGPVAASLYVQAKYSPGGLHVHRTLNNCAYGFTPWGTYLTCEERLNNYFVNADADQPPLPETAVNLDGEPRYAWETAVGDVNEVNDEFARFDASSRGVSALEDYRNEPNRFDGVVDIGPYDPSAMPFKRIALDRMKHEG